MRVSFKVTHFDADVLEKDRNWEDGEKDIYKWSVGPTTRGHLVLGENIGKLVF